MMQQEFVRIPQDRIGVLVGAAGEVKAEIERTLEVKITIDSEDGVVIIDNVGEDVLACWKGRDIVKAIGRGFSPRKAMRLVSDDYALEIIELQDYLGRSKKAMARQKARIIGTQGKTRRHIEEATGASLAISGKTAALIGQPDEVAVAKEAVVKLLDGVPHSAVYRYLERKARDLKEARMSLWKPKPPDY